ncbi:hypothetical protein CEXT_17021 [Caerostris extrusa]|uniref:Uncharacterized protein n=1 Tax=Caerostris extrusa TaxID=172846 RepID=A0AAV4S4F3_CAEEX|nr:hypothetical protein CEXT_17021 [Caerostris extrusa]
MTYNEFLTLARPYSTGRKIGNSLANRNESQGNLLLSLIHPRKFSKTWVATNTLVRFLENPSVFLLLELLGHGHFRGFQTSVAYNEFWFQKIQFWNTVLYFNNQR